jgi:hypothetical protein
VRDDEKPFHERKEAVQFASRAGYS